MIVCFKALYHEGLHMRALYSRKLAMALLLEFGLIPEGEKCSKALSE